MTTAAINLQQRLIFFIGIGGSAALVHILSVFFLVHYLDLSPLIANIFAFFIAFTVSYTGHKKLTFAGLGNEKELSLPHYFLVASSAGLLNEGLYYVLLKYTQLEYMLALICVLGFVSVYTYIVSHLWACRLPKST